MSKISVSRHINAPKKMVFQAISDIQNFSQAVPDIVNVKFLSDTKYGVGTKFEETRDMNGRKAVTVLEVTELKDNDYIRLVSDAGGTIWDSVFSVREDGEQTKLTLVMESKPYKLMAKIATPLMKRMLKKALVRDMEAVKTYCENGQS